MATSQRNYRRKFICFLYFLGILSHFWGTSLSKLDWIQRKGLEFVDEFGRPFAVNGANFYWLMYRAVDADGRSDVLQVLRQAKELQFNLIRTWAFSDGGLRALQISPGVFNEEVFQALDFVVSEAGKFGIRLLMTLVNSWPQYGGQPQYEQWAKDEGVVLTSDAAFYTDPILRGFYRHYVQILLNRVNTVTGVPYKDDPTIFGWELINEPRLYSDTTGNVIGDWVEEMAAHVKSIDSRHLLTTGMEGYYGFSTPGRRWVNPNGDFGQGTDFIRHHSYETIDFATVHSYPDLWLSNDNHKQRMKFLKIWVNVHIEDATKQLQKPVMFTEFGKFKPSNNFTESQRQEFMWTIFDSVYSSLAEHGAGVGALVWQLLPLSMKRLWEDGFAIYTNDIATLDLILAHSHRLALLTRNAASIHSFAVS